MRILILGGTVFLGPHLVEAARGHDVTIFHRGKHPSDAPPEVRRIVGDRDRVADLSALAKKGPWDAVIDTCGYLPRQVRTSAAVLHGVADRYVFVSSISVYDDPVGAVDENAPLAAPVEAVEKVTPETYGPMKAACEAEARDAFAERALVLRPGLIVGPRDPTDRYTYWIRRVARGGPMLAPGDGSRRVQFVDVRDLAAFTVHLLSRRMGGTLNVTGLPLRFDTFLRVAAEATGVTPDLRWTPETDLLGRGVAPWVDLPLWIAGQDQTAGVARALASGLRLRDPIETARATWAWDRARDPSTPLLAGLSDDREAALLRSADAG